MTNIYRTLTLPTDNTHTVVVEHGDHYTCHNVVADSYDEAVKLAQEHKLEVFDSFDIAGADKIKFGVRKSDGVNIYLDKPKFDCGWYWGFGYLGNHNEHYHLSGYQNGRNIDMYNALEEDYDLTPAIKKNLWTFCELALTAYSLKNTAEVLGRGGSHMTTNPLADMIKNRAEVERINKMVLPLIFNKLAELYQDQ